MLDEQKFKFKLQNELEKEEKFSAVVILTIISIALEVFLFMYKNCLVTKVMLKNAVRNKGLIYKRFLNKHIIPKLNTSNLSDEEKNQAIEKVNQLILSDELDEFLSEHN